MKISQKISELLNGHDFHIEFSKGHNSAKSISGVTVIFLFIMAWHYIHTMFREKISKGFRVIEWTWFPYKKIQRRIILSKMLVELQFLISTYCMLVLGICTKFNENISKGFRVIEQTQFSYKYFQRGTILSKM